MVCTESTINIDGFTASTWPSNALSSLSAARYISACRLPVRSARSRTCPADSSPVTYKHRPWLSAHRCAVSSNNVDLPTPGSPASSTTAPGTSPPPSTRSNSLTPVDNARADSMSTSPIGRAADVGAPATMRVTDPLPRSSMLPQAWHSGQRPSHFATSLPHSAHRKVGRAVFATNRTVEHGTDRTARPQLRHVFEETSKIFWRACRSAGVPVRRISGRTREPRRNKT
jgi:hypothetical protein